MLSPKNSSYYVIDGAGGQAGFSSGSELWTFTRNGSDPQWFRLHEVNLDDYLDLTSVPTAFTNVTGQWGNKTVALKFGLNGNYASSWINENGTPLQARSSNLDSWETFETVLTEDGFIGFRNVNNKKYISVNPYSRPATLSVTGESLLGWEYFQIFQCGSDYYLRSAVNGFWVYPHIDTVNAPVMAYARAAGGWCPFSLVDLSPPPEHDNIYISNIDPDNTYIEIHNPTETPISAKGLYLSNDNGDCFMWQMPLVIIRPNQRVLIKVCDEINSGDMVLARMQTDFDLADGDTLRLSDAGGNVLSVYEL